VPLRIKRAIARFHGIACGQYFERIGHGILPGVKNRRPTFRQGDGPKEAASLSARSEQFPDQTLPFGLLHATRLHHRGSVLDMGLVDRGDVPHLLDGLLLHDFRPGHFALTIGTTSRGTTRGGLDGERESEHEKQSDQGQETHAKNLQKNRAKPLRNSK
jgi:hypothetical protein